MFNDNNPYNSSPESDPRPDDLTNTGSARIKVIGVGGAGNNAVNRMLAAGINSAEFYVVNTDRQILALSPCKNKIQIGKELTKGLGAGAEPEIGQKAAEESKEALTEAVQNTDLLFITAGMGGGTGTGAAPVIARIARELKILTVAVVTEPFSFEGRVRLENTAKGLDNLRKYVDTLIIIPNDKIRTVIPKDTPMTEALRVADEILKQGIRGIAELIVNPSLINLDFADVRRILKDKGIAHLGVGVAKGDNRILEAVRLAISSPLLQTTIEGARGVILNICGGQDLTFDEVDAAAELVKGVVDASANIIFGARIDPDVHEEVEITVIATGFPGYDPKPKEEPPRSAPANNRGGVNKFAVNGPYYPPRQVMPQAPQPPQEQAPQYPNYPQYPQYPQYPAQQPVQPVQQPPVQPHQPVQQTPPEYRQPQQPQQPQRPYTQAPQQPAPAEQPRADEGIERQTGRKLPKFIQRLKNGNRNDE